MIALFFAAIIAVQQPIQMVCGPLEKMEEQLLIRFGETLNDQYTDPKLKTVERRLYYNRTTQTWSIFFVKGDAACLGMAGQGEPPSIRGGTDT